MIKFLWLVLFLCKKKFHPDTLDFSLLKVQIALRKFYLLPFATDRQSSSKHVSISCLLTIFSQFIFMIIFTPLSIYVHFYLFE